MGVTSVSRFLPAHKREPRIEKHTITIYPHIVYFPTTTGR